MMTDAIAANRQAALDLAGQGLFVFPVQSGGTKAKAPYPFFKWKELATTDARTIEGWWLKWPDAAVGLHLGKSGLIVIDCDRHDPEADGVEAFGKVMADHGFNPDSCPLVATPSEGNHLYFRNTIDHGNGEGNLPKGVNVRGSGGYVVAPGTVMADGRVYEQFGSLADAPDLPQWLIDLIRPAKPDGVQNAPQREFTRSPESELAEMEELLSHIPADLEYNDWISVMQAIHAETGGSGTGLSIADNWSAQGSKYKGRREIEAKWKSFKGSGVTGATIAQFARDHGADLSAIAGKYTEHADPDFDPIEAQRVADTLLKNFLDRKNTAIKAEIAEIDESIGGAVSEFDLPESYMHPGGVVEELTNWICEWSPEPIRIHALGAALVIVGSLIGRKVYSQTRPTGTALYIGITAPSGMGKQHPQDAIRLALDSVVNGSQMHTGWNVSLPAIATGLKEMASKVMIADEFADKLIGLRSKNASTSQTAISEGLRTLWGTNTGAYTPDVSMSRGEIKIKRPCLSFFGASTNRDFSRALVSKDVTNGLFNRFLILPRFEDVKPQAEPDGIMALPQDLSDKLKWLYNCLGDMQSVMAVRGDGYPLEPVMVPFCDAAKKMDAENKVHQRKMMREADEDEALALYGRYAEQIKRVALIVACGRSCDRMKNAEISEADMKFARNLVDYSIQQFVLTVRRDMVKNWIEENRNTVLSVIRKAKKIKRSALLRRVRHISARDMRDIIGMLIEAECIVETVEREGRYKPLTSYEYVQG